MEQKPTGVSSYILAPSNRHTAGAKGSHREPRKGAKKALHLQIDALDILRSFLDNNSTYIFRYVVYVFY